MTLHRVCVINGPSLFSNRIEDKVFMTRGPEFPADGDNDFSLSSRRPEFLDAGGIVRKADLIRDAEVVRGLYIQPSAIEHLADVTPEYSADKLTEYYATHPGLILLVADLPQIGVVGALGIDPEQGLHAAKFSKLVTKADQRGRHVAYRLLRAGLKYAFSPQEQGGLGCQQVMAAIIQDVNGDHIAHRTFERVGFDYYGPRLWRRCDSWSLREQRLVPRDVRQMFIQRDTYAMRYGKDLRNLPRPSGQP